MSIANLITRTFTGAAAAVFWIAPQLKGYQPALPLLIKSSVSV